LNEEVQQREEWRRRAFEPALEGRLLLLLLWKQMSRIKQFETEKQAAEQTHTQTDIQAVMQAEPG